MPKAHKKNVFHRSISQQFQILAQLYQQEQASEITTQTLMKLIEFEKNSNEKQLDDLKKDVFFFEKQYGMKSDQFYKEYQNGKRGDDMDFIEWASLIQMINRIEQKIEILNGSSL
ncbi:MAG: hypothetical protein HQK75_08165 [Candidatus Magnetomorum sp.]|nr:hypothetical protein [Candidatus Magnetomorum sp.]